MVIFLRRLACCSYLLFKATSSKDLLRPLVFVQMPARAPNLLASPFGSAPRTPWHWFIAIGNAIPEKHRGPRPLQLGRRRLMSDRNSTTQSWMNPIGLLGLDGVCGFRFSQLSL